MGLVLVTPPAAEPLPLDELKEHLRVDHDDEDARLADYIRTAASRLDGRDGLLGRCLITQTWRLTLPCFPAEIALPLPPLQSVDAIAYVDTGGTARTLAADAYTVSGIGDVSPARISPAYGMSWPSTRTGAEAVIITFTAGYGDSDVDVPAPIRHAIAMYAGHLYNHREAVLDTNFATITPMGLEELIAPHRTWAF